MLICELLYWLCSYLMWARLVCINYTKLCMPKFQIVLCQHMQNQCPWGLTSQSIFVCGEQTVEFTISQTFVEYHQPSSSIARPCLTLKPSHLYLSLVLRSPPSLILLQWTADLTSSFPRCHSTILRMRTVMKSPTVAMVMFVWRFLLASCKASQSF